MFLNRVKYVGEQPLHCEIKEYLHRVVSLCLGINFALCLFWEQRFSQETLKAVF